MSTLVIEHDDSGQITGWRYEATDDYEPDGGELVVDDEQYDHRQLQKKRVDVSVDPPVLVDDPDFRAHEVINRAKISKGSRQQFADDRAAKEAARDEFDTAQSTATGVEQPGPIDSSTDTQQQLDDLQAQIDALDERTTAQQGQLDALRTAVDHLQAMVGDVWEVLVGRNGGGPK